MSQILVTCFLDKLSKNVDWEAFDSPSRKSNEKQKKKKKLEKQLQSFLR